MLIKVLRSENKIKLLNLLGFSNYVYRIKKYQEEVNKGDITFPKCFKSININTLDRNDGFNGALIRPIHFVLTTNGL